MATNSFTYFNFRQITVSVVGLWCLILAISPSLQAQPVLGAQNTALGSGGTAYLTGVEATFWNPANLMIKDRSGRIHIGLGQTGILYEPVLSSDAADDQFFNFTDSFYPYKPSAVAINNAQRQTILTQNYPRNNLLSQHQTRADIILAGALWQRNDAAFSFAARARFASRIEVGRGWYSNEFISSNEQEVRNLTLDQQINQLLEFSVGYAREFTFLDGLMSRLSKLYVGIAPKIVLAGPSFNASYNARYIRSGNNNPEIYATDFFYRTTGQYSGMTNQYLATSNPSQAINNNLNRKLKFDNTGFGVGFDFGLTYLIPLGDDLSFLDQTSKETTISKSIRVSFSANDVGFVRYNENPLTLSAPKDTAQIASESPKNAMFIGSGGQYLNYFDEATAIPNPITSANQQNSNSFSGLLPTSLNAGMLVDLSRVKFTGDFTLGLNNTAFTSTKLAFHVGVEARPHKLIPVRLGTRIASGLPTRLGMGTGIETRHWDLTLGTQIILRSRTFTSEFVGGAFAGIQLHL